MQKNPQQADTLQDVPPMDIDQFLKNHVAELDALVDWDEINNTENTRKQIEEILKKASPQLIKDDHEL